MSFESDEYNSNDIQEEENKNPGVEFSSEENSKDLRMLFAFLSIILSSLVIFKTYAFIIQVNHALYKVDEINEYFEKNVLKKLINIHNLEAFFKYAKICRLKSDIWIILSIFCVIYLSIKKNAQISVLAQLALALIPFCGIITSIYFGLQAYKKYGLFCFFSSISMTLIVGFLYKNRIGVKSSLLISLIFYYFSFLFIANYFGAKLIKYIARYHSKPFLQAFNNQTEIFDPIKKACKNYKYKIENILFNEYLSDESKDESLLIVWYQDVFTSLINIFSPIKIKNPEIKRFLVSYTITFISKSFNEYFFWANIAKILVLLVEMILVASLNSCFYKSLFFYELTAIVFSIHYIFNDYLGQIAYNIIYKKGYEKLINNMIESSEESIYIFDDLQKELANNPLFYSITRTYELFTWYPSLKISCDKALNAIKRFDQIKY